MKRVNQQRRKKQKRLKKHTIKQKNKPAIKDRKKSELGTSQPMETLKLEPQKTDKEK